MMHKVTGEVHLQLLIPVPKWKKKWWMENEHGYERLRVGSYKPAAKLHRAVLSSLLLELPVPI